MIDVEQMSVVLDEGGMTVRCLEADGGNFWAITRKPEASMEALESALERVPNPTGFRMNFPINGEFTYEFFCAN